MNPPIVPILRIPDTILNTTYTVLPEPNAIDAFLLLNGIIPNCTGPTSILDPVRMNDVTCVVQLTVKIVS